MVFKLVEHFASKNGIKMKRKKGIKSESEKLKSVNVRMV